MRRRQPPVRDEERERILAAAHYQPFTPCAELLAEQKKTMPERIADARYVLRWCGEKIAQKVADGDVMLVGRTLSHTGNSSLSAFSFLDLLWRAVPAANTTGAERGSRTTIELVAKADSQVGPRRGAERTTETKSYHAR